MQQNQEKITPESSDGKTLLFTPKDNNEAMHIQRSLFGMGYRWRDNKGQNLVNVFGTLAVSNKAVWEDPTFSDLTDAITCTADQLGYDVATPAIETVPAGKKISVPGDEAYQNTIQDVFNNQTDAAKQLFGKGRRFQVRSIDEDVFKESVQNIKSMIGVEKGKSHIDAMADLARIERAMEKKGLLKGEPDSRHLILEGPPGTGKTSYARDIAGILYALGITRENKCIETTRSSFVGPHIGSTEEKTDAILESAMGGVLFIDEAPQLYVARSENDFGHLVIGKLVSALENNRDDLVVIVAGYAKDMKPFIESDAGLASRFLTRIPFPAFTDIQLGEVLDLMLEQRGFTMDDDARELAMALVQENRDKNKEKFANARTVRNLVGLAKLTRAPRLVKAGLTRSDQNGLSDEDWEKAVTNFTVADIAKIAPEDLNLDQAIGGNFGFKQESQSQRLIAKAATP